MTPLQACEETKILWKIVARDVQYYKKFINKGFIPGPWQEYSNSCPCCEAAITMTHSNTRLIDCSKCPMMNDWIIPSLVSENKVDIDTYCESTGSPYFAWVESESNGLCIDVEFFCLLIAELAHGRAEIIKEEIKGGLNRRK